MLSAFFPCAPMCQVSPYNSQILTLKLIFRSSQNKKPSHFQVYCLLHSIPFPLTRGDRVTRDHGVVTNCDCFRIRKTNFIQQFQQAQMMTENFSKFNPRPGIFAVRDQHLRWDFGNKKKKYTKQKEEKWIRSRQGEGMPQRKVIKPKQNSIIPIRFFKVPSNIFDLKDDIFLDEDYFIFMLKYASKNVDGFLKLKRNRIFQPLPNETKLSLIIMKETMWLCMFVRVSRRSNKESYENILGQKISEICI